MQAGVLQLISGNTATTPAKRPGSRFPDPQDLDQNGVVSVSERLTYSLRHPTLNTAKRAVAAEKTSAPLFQYTQKGTLNSREKPTSKLFDMYA